MWAWLVRLIHHTDKNTGLLYIYNQKVWKSHVVSGLVRQDAKEKNWEDVGLQFDEHFSVDAQALFSQARVSLLLHCRSEILSTLLFFSSQGEDSVRLCCLYLTLLWKLAVSYQIEKDKQCSVYARMVIVCVCLCVYVFKKQVFAFNFWYLSVLLSVPAWMKLWVCSCVCVCDFKAVWETVFIAD